MIILCLPVNSQIKSSELNEKNATILETSDRLDKVDFNNLSKNLSTTGLQVSR